jgi:hypothetical protein
MDTCKRYCSARDVSEIVAAHDNQVSPIADTRTPRECSRTATQGGPPAWMASERDVAMTAILRLIVGPSPSQK